jgi:hypothetical protein
MKNLIVIKDKAGRELMCVNEKYKVVVSRYNDLNKESVDRLVHIYSTITQDPDTERIRKFLMFEEDHMTFCS